MRSAAIGGWRKVDGLMDEDERQSGRQDRLHQEPQVGCLAGRLEAALDRDTLGHGPQSRFST